MVWVFWNWFLKNPGIFQQEDTMNLLNFSSILGFALDLTPPGMLARCKWVGWMLGIAVPTNVMSSWWRWHPRWRVVPKTTYILSLAGSVSMFRGHLHCGLFVSKHVDWVLRHLEGLVLFGRWPSIIDCSWKIPLVFFWGVVVNAVVILSEVVCWVYFGVCFFASKACQSFHVHGSVGWVFHGIPHQRFPSQITTTFLPEERPGRCNATGGQLASLTLWH